MFSTSLWQRHNLLKLFVSMMTIAFIILLLPKSEAGVALAQGGGLYSEDGSQFGPGKGVPHRLGPTKPLDKTMQRALQSITSKINIANDGGFEGGTPSTTWAESSTNFGTPICDVNSCGTGSGSGPRTGLFWAWFGGISFYEEGTLSQNITIPVGSVSLIFYLEQFVCDSVFDYLEVLVDGNQVFYTDGSSPLCDSLGYVEQRANVSAFADGGVHTLEFHSEVFGVNFGVSNFFVDDVTLDSVEIPFTDCTAVAGNPFTNCSFEEGDFTGWVPTDHPNPFYPLEVNTGGVSPGFGLFTSAPTHGSKAALHGFDAEGPRQNPNVLNTCSSPNLVIPDDSVIGNVTSITYGGVEVPTLGDLDIYTQASHTWVGDLVFRLQRGLLGTQVTFFDRPGVPADTWGCSGNDVNVLFDDEAGSSVEPQCSDTTPAINGKFKPNNPLSAFDGQDFNATWFLNVSDRYPGDTGTLDQWCLVPSTTGPDTIRLAQDVTLPPGDAFLEFDYRVGWDLTFVDNPAAIDRVFQVTVEPPGGGTPLISVPILNVPNDTLLFDSGPLHAAVNAGPVAGNTVRVSFDWFIPDDFSGPAFFQLDNVYINSDRSEVYLPIMIKPGPARALITNNTGASMTYQIPDSGNPAPPEGTVSCTVPVGAVQFFCDKEFTPGTYTWRAVATCGVATGSRTYNTGNNDIPDFFCK